MDRQQQHWSDVETLKTTVKKLPLPETDKLQYWIGRNLEVILSIGGGEGLVTSLLSHSGGHDFLRKCTKQVTETGRARLLESALHFRQPTRGELERLIKTAISLHHVWVLDTLLCHLPVGKRVVWLEFVGDRAFHRGKMPMVKSVTSEGWCRQSAYDAFRSLSIRLTRVPARKRKHRRV